MVKACCTTMLTTCFLAAGVANAGTGGWVEFADETAQRLVSDPTLGVSDVEEKDYAWGDVDNDGDIDLIVVRKVPFTNPGGKVNVLFMNENIADDGQAIDGVLVDRTSQYAINADDGGQGFNDLTNDRDVALGDLNNDGWLDLVTAPTLSDTQPKTISHPRIYMNLGESGGNWLGFQYQESRTPQLFTMGGSPQAPRFCSVAIGDVTGDGFADVYFGDYDSAGCGGSGQNPSQDLNDRLFVNLGFGNPAVFADSLETRMTSTMLLSAFGTAVAIEDMNNDGVMDIVKDTGLQTPTRVSVSYNDPSDEGIFDQFQVVYNNSPYFISVGDLNQDGRLDIVITDDGTDRYMLNQGNNASGQAIFTQLTFPSGPSAGFGSNSVIADLNNDEFMDVLIADVDVDCAGCSRRMHIYRNLGDLPSISFAEQGEVIPSSQLNGTHDVAVFDINGDQWLDLVIGRCGGTQVWINQPPQGLFFSYPDGLPSLVSPNTSHDFRVRLSPTQGGEPQAGTGRLYYRVDGAPSYTEVPLPEEVPNLYLASLPGTECTNRIEFYVSAEKEGGGLFFDPPAGPGAPYVAIAGDLFEITLRDEIEGDVSSWTIVNDPSLTAGGWEQAEPVGTIFNNQLAEPDADDTSGSENTKAFVTQVSTGGAAGDSDIDGGPTTLISPAFDLGGTDGTVSYSRWVFSDGSFGHTPDTMAVEVSGNGVDWTLVENVGDTGSEWEAASFVVGDYITPTSTVQVRFVIGDNPNDSVTEGGIDNFQIEAIDCCGTDCADPEDGMIDVTDLLQVLGDWGQVGMPCDVDGNGVIEVGDLLAVLAEWGPCP
ncbi:MAG: FG-GAP-like repeat-containing protein [Planctomycetota bacterium]|jgi:hypothetical protein